MKREGCREERMQTTGNVAWPLIRIGIVRGRVDHTKSFTEKGITDRELKGEIKP